jgi:hypothetical protein
VTRSQVRLTATAAEGGADADPVLGAGPDRIVGGTGPAGLVDPGPHDALLALLALCLLARALLSFGDTWSVSARGIGLFAADGLAPTGMSVGWAVLWGVVALSGAFGLARRKALGWLLAAAACVAYLVAGIGDTVALGGAEGPLTAATWLGFLVDLALPALVLAALFAIRPWFLAAVREP